MLKTSIVLDSPAAFKDELGKANIFYPIMGVIAVIVGLINGGFSGAIALCLIALALVYAVIHFVAGFKIVKISRQKFSLPSAIGVDKEALAGCLAASLSQYGMSIENKTVLNLDFIRISHDGMVYDVLIEDGSFTINPKEANRTHSLKGRRYARLYKKAIASVPIIVFTIQNILKQSEMTINKEDTSCLVKS